jgi:hypothetical protein
LTAERYEPLAASTVIKLASILTLDDGAFIVGGQALNLWAERYASARPELVAFGPFTSKDLDYFGYRAAAQKLADALGGKMVVPRPDDHTPSSALVTAIIDGREIEIDFLSNVLGVRASSLEREAVELLVPLSDGDQLAVPIMHPLHCLQSRIANVVRLHRQDETARRQLAAAPIVLEAYIDEMLRLGDLREATGTLASLFQYLRSDIDARACPTLPMRDPSSIISMFIRDKRLDWRFRWFNLRAMRRKLGAQRN